MLFWWEHWHISLIFESQGSNNIYITVFAWTHPPPVGAGAGARAAGALTRATAAHSWGL